MVAPFQSDHMRENLNSPKAHIEGTELARFFLLLRKVYFAIYMARAEEKSIKKAHIEGTE